jgi:type II secretory ATPase GspE/PulE/Tfp pilus assembly ATPase PilB-like protein
MLNAGELLRDVAGLNDSVRLVDRILRAGLLMNASDVHFDPMRDAVRVRFRIDGMLEEALSIPSTMAAAVTSRLKILASLDIAERRAPQDGGFSWKMPGASLSPLDVRMATLPVRHGERITLRLLETGGRRLGIGDLGMSAADRATFEKTLDNPQGLLLLTGPTGSGKTTTLYAAINRLLAGAPKNILTVEDPVEYEIPGVAQAEVDSSDKVNFAKALKSLLRHDPDVVMIGEIRDAASLDAAVKASLTGHLVLSTLHTGGAKATLTRLVDMGLDAPLAAAVLQLAVAQRLVRRLCPACRVESGRGWTAKGCPECGMRGYRGRTGIFEMFSPSAGIETSMAEDAKAKVDAGVTSEAEVVRVMGEE